MGAPTYIVENPVQPARSYTSAPRVPTPWKPGRPGELNGPQPWGDQLGTPGPDTGYALKLVERCVDELTLGAGEHLSLIHI